MKYLCAPNVVEGFADMLPSLCEPLQTLQRWRHPVTSLCSLQVIGKEKRPLCSPGVWGMRGGSFQTITGVHHGAPIQRDASI